MLEVVNVQDLEDIETVAKIKDIPSQLVINWDQTTVKYVFVSSQTQKKKGAKCNEIVSTNDKIQIAGIISEKFYLHS